MGILDEAIREHLELKRQHGAEDSELKQLEDEAFGPPQRPGAEPDGEGSADPAAEAPTEFMAQPDLDEAQPKEPAPAPRREMADIQEPPAPVEGEKSAPEEDTGEQEAEKPEEEPPVEEERPAAEEPSATEHEAIPAPPEPGGHTTEERHAIADQPTEMYDVEDSFASTGAPAPPDEDLVAEADVGEARLGPAEKLPGADEERDEELEDEDDFFDEQRLSDELDQALEAPVQDEPEDEPEPISEEHTEVREPISEEQPAAERPGKDEDVLEETPDFLEEAPEDDQLWFEQKPPKDFDFDD